MLTTMRAEIHAELQAGQEAIRQRLASGAKLEGPLFSVAADTDHDMQLDANGPGYEELRYLKHRKAVFPQICGDKPAGGDRANTAAFAGAGVSGWLRPMPHGNGIAFPGGGAGPWTLVRCSWRCCCRLA